MYNPGKYTHEGHTDFYYAGENLRHVRVTMAAGTTNFVNTKVVKNLLRGASSTMAEAAAGFYYAVERMHIDSGTQVLNFQLQTVTANSTATTIYGPKTIPSGFGDIGFPIPGLELAERDVIRVLSSGGTGTGVKSVDLWLRVLPIEDTAPQAAKVPA